LFFIPYYDRHSMKSRSFELACAVSTHSFTS
jgi:hypothetical protein